MAESYKNTETFPVGTRVKRSTKMPTGARGTVIAHDETPYGREFGTMTVQWDGDNVPHSHTGPFEIKRAD